MQYRPAIDGLRAVAVVPVIVFHANSAWLPGGFAGVDVFFVISGYLIAGLLLDELRQASRIDIVRFYERRARRILPALLVVMAVVALTGLVLLLPSELRELGRQIAYTSLFVSNLFGVAGGYFDTANELRPLFHTWSLSVEEQFYIVFPLALVLAHRFAPRRMLTYLTAAAVVFFVLALAIGLGNSDGSYYSSATRAWELLAGAVCAAIPRPVQRPWLALVGLAAVVLMFVVYDNTTPWPSLFTLLPVFGVVLFLLHGTETGLASRLLSFGPLVSIGLVSYSAYLIHQPLYAFARILGVATPEVLVILMVATLGLAALSWRFVEQPWRRRRAPEPTARRRLLAGSVVALLAFAAIGASFDWSRGLAGRLPPDVAAILATQDDDLLECGGKKPLDGGCIYGPPEAVRVAILGDSHAKALALGFGAALAERGIALAALTREGCAPLEGVDKVKPRGGGRGCPAVFESFLRQVEESDQIEVVVVSARWSRWVERVTFDNGEGGVEGSDESIVSVDGTVYRDKSQDYLDALERSFQTTIGRLQAMGKHVIVVGPIPEAGWDVPDRLARLVLSRTGSRPLTTSAAVFAERAHDARALIASVPVVTFDPAAVLCSLGPEGRCMNERDGVPLYRDDDHLSRAGAELVATRLLAKLDGMGWLGTEPALH